MNYFELFEIPVQFNPEPTIIRKKFYELSRKFHPDFYSQSSTNEQQEALQTSSMINRAYKTFQDKDATIRYVLALYNLIEEEEKYELDKGFLMQVLELNELLMEVDPGDASANRQIKLKTEELNHELYSDIKPILDNYKEGVTSKEELLQVKDYYYKKKYLQRILDKLA